MTPERIIKLVERMAALKFPAEPVADWKGKNHFEIVNPSAQKTGDEYWWIAVKDFNNASTEGGQRLGLALDMACAVPDLLRDRAEMLGIIKRWLEQCSSCDGDGVWRTIDGKNEETCWYCGHVPESIRCAAHGLSMDELRVRAYMRRHPGWRIEEMAAALKMSEERACDISLRLRRM